MDRDTSHKRPIKKVPYLCVCKLVLLQFSFAFYFCSPSVMWKSMKGEIHYIYIFTVYTHAYI